MADKNATSGEAIGRPAPWQEGRYQQGGSALDNSVTPDQPLDSKSPPKHADQETIPTGPVSTPVHLDEYTSAGDQARGADADKKRS